MQIYSARKIKEIPDDMSAHTHNGVWNILVEADGKNEIDRDELKKFA